MKKPERITLSEEEVTALLGKLSACDLEVQDKKILMGVIQFYLWLQWALQETTLTVHRLRSLFGLKSERLKNLPTILAEEGNSEDIPSEGEGEAGMEDKSRGLGRFLNQTLTLLKGKKEPLKLEKAKRKGHGRLRKELYTGATLVKHDHETLHPGDACPESCGGRLYALKPKVMICLTGHSLASATKHWFESEVIIGADEFGNKEVVAVTDGFRESEQSWTEILLDLKHRGLVIGPKLAVGDGSLGFWKALHKIYSETKQQRCWVHKTANILNKLPKTLQAKAKSHIHDIWMNETKADAEKSFDFFVEIYEAVYPKAAECLAKDRNTLLAFYSFPAEHWRHIRTTNPIESTFSTVRLRTEKTRGCLSRQTAFTMVFKLIESAQKRWQKLNKPHKVAEVIRGVDFVNGIAQPIKAERIAA